MFGSTATHVRGVAPTLASAGTNKKQPSLLGGTPFPLLRVILAKRSPRFALVTAPSDQKTEPREGVPRLGQGFGCKRRGEKLANWGGSMRMASVPPVDFWEWGEVSRIKLI